MIKERISFFKQLEVLADGTLASMAFFAIYPLVTAYPFMEYARIFPIFLAIWLALLHFLGMYHSFRIKEVSDILLTIWASVCIGVGIFGASAYLLKFQDFSRVFIICIFFVVGVLTSAEKVLIMSFFRQIRKKGYNFRRILVVGTGPRAQKFMKLIRERGEWGLKIIGLIDEDRRLIGEELSGFRVLGTLSDVPSIAHENAVDEVMFIVPRSWFYKIDKVIAFCETEGIRVHIAVDVFESQFAKPKQTDLEGFLLLTFERTSIKVWQLFLKGVFDIVVSGMLLVLLMPVFVIIAVAITTTSKGPVFFRQTRVGLNGRKFTLYKFRTMVKNAEALLPELMAQNEMEGPVFKMENDPRVTPLGRFLRKYSLDELPQLWNVFTRDMSLVGPRPPIPEEVNKYDSWQRRRLNMRPGITCLWQVQGRNKITNFDEWMRLDLHYIDHWSFIMDLRVMAKTVPAVLFGVGAK